MITLRIRWRVLYQLWCLVVGHEPKFVQGFTAWDRSLWFCERCCQERPAHRIEMRKHYDDNGWHESTERIWQSLDWDGNVLSEMITATARNFKKPTTGGSNA